MKNLIKKLLREAIQTIHYETRVYDRFVRPTSIIVGYEIPNSRGRYNEVGRYKIPESLKNSIIKRSKLVEDFNFPSKKSYAIKIADIFIDKNNVEYYSQRLKGEVLNNNYKLLFLETKTDSNGDQIYAIVRDNEITTAFFGKSYSMKDVNAKMNVDVYISNIEKFIQDNQPKEREVPENTNQTVINIDGVKWVVDSETEKIYKKNKRDEIYDVWEFIDKLPDDIANEILSFIVK